MWLFGLRVCDDLRITAVIMSLDFFFLAPPSGWCDYWWMAINPATHTCDSVCSEVRQSRTHTINANRQLIGLKNCKCKYCLTSSLPSIVLARLVRFVRAVFTIVSFCFFVSHPLTKCFSLPRSPAYRFVVIEFLVAGYSPIITIHQQKSSIPSSSRIINSFALQWN